MQRDAALVLETTEITPGVFVTWYDAPSLAAGATPGQFVMVDPGWETGSFDPLLPRAFSYYRFRRADGVEGERQFALLYAVVGRVTEAMARQQPGDQLWMTGPLGRGFEVNRNARSLLLVGGGVGVAPLVALADQEVERGRSIVLCFGARAAAGVFPAALLPPQVEYYVSTEDGSLGQARVWSPSCSPSTSAGPTSRSPAVPCRCSAAWVRWSEPTACAARCRF